MKAVNDYGGIEMLNKAEATLNKNPIAKLALRAAGIDIDKMKQELNGTPARAANVTRNNRNSYRDRLSRLK